MIVESDDFPNNEHIDRIYFAFEDDSVLLLMKSEGEHKHVGLDVFTISRHGASYSKRRDHYFRDQRALTPFIGATLTCTWDILTQHYAMWMYGMSFNNGLPWLLLQPESGSFLLYAQPQLSVLPPKPPIHCLPENPAHIRKKLLPELDLHLINHIKAIDIMPVHGVDDTSLPCAAKKIAFSFAHYDHVVLFSPAEDRDEINIEVIPAATHQSKNFIAANSLSAFVGSSNFSIYSAFNNINNGFNLCLLSMDNVSLHPRIILQSKNRQLYIHHVLEALPLMTPYHLKKGAST
ncbi:MAG: hypothetical protein AAF900_02465 [Bacteroidota bacterium]